MSDALLARLAGLTYLVLIITGVFGLMYVPSSLIDWGDPGNTATQIADKLFLFILGVVAEIACFVCFIALPLLLHRLLAFAGQQWSYSMVTLALISIPVSLANAAKHMDAALLLDNHNYLSGFDANTLNAQLMYLLASYNNASTLTFIFWSAWLAPLGILVYRSNIFPNSSEFSSSSEVETTSPNSCSSSCFRSIPFLGSSACPTR